MMELDITLHIIIELKETENQIAGGHSALNRLSDNYLR